MDKKKILVVDDDKSILTLLQKVLTDEGYQVITAYSGEEGIEEAENFKPDLVLADYKMPGINGNQMVEKIKTLNPKTIAILITAFGTEEVAVEAIRKGVDNYIKKPFDIEELLNIIKACFSSEGRPLREVLAHRVEALEKEMRVTQKDVKFFKALSDRTRQRIINLLRKKDHNVTELVKFFDTSQPTISHHLSVLKAAGTVECYRKGKEIYYTLNRPEMLERYTVFTDKYMPK